MIAGDVTEAGKASGLEAHWAISHLAVSCKSGLLGAAGCP
jgi:hypothetical protein